MTEDASIDPLKIAEQRPDRSHLFRGLSIHHRIAKLCEIGGIDKLTPKQDDYWKRLQFRLEKLQDLASDTINELDDKNIHLLQARLAEIETLVQETFYSTRVPYLSTMGEWTDSLLTKYCSSDYDLDATLHRYEELGVSTEVIDDEDTGYHVVLSSKDQTDVHGTQYRKGQILSSVFFREATFHPQFR